MIGPPGSGKTLLCVYLLKKAMDRGIPVYANFHMQGAQELRIEDALDMNFPEMSWVCFDEFYSYVDSRLSMSLKNIATSWLLFQSRKRHMDMLITAQLFGAIDLRARNLTQVIVLCEQRRDGFHYTITTKRNVRAFVMPFTVAKRYYPLYDTFELITPQVRLSEKRWRRGRGG